MARSSSIGNLAYYGAIGGGGFLAYKLALDGTLGCAAYKAIADIYRSIKGVVPPAPRADTPAGKVSECKNGLAGASAPPTAGAARPAAAAAATTPPPAAAQAPGTVQGPPFDHSLVHATTLTDSGMFPVIWDGNERMFRQDPDQGGTNTYDSGSYFIDSNQKNWTWLGPELVLVSWDTGETRPISDFFA